MRFFFLAQISTVRFLSYAGDSFEAAPSTDPRTWLAAVAFIAAYLAIAYAILRLMFEKPEQPTPEQTCPKHGTYYAPVCPICEQMVPRRCGW